MNALNIPRGPVIAPSILSCDFARMGEDCQAVIDGGAKLLHVDVMDGHFVPNLTFGPDLIKALRRSVSVPLDVHLMISNPEKYVEAYAEAGADIITVHAESTHHLHRVIQQIKETGKKAGVSLNPATPVSVLEVVLAEVDLVLIMTVNPGFGGQKPIPAAINKIQQLRQLIGVQNLMSPPLIEVDGGVKIENIHDYAGADYFVSGSGVFKLPGWTGPSKDQLNKAQLTEAYKKVLGGFEARFPEL